MGCGGGQKAQDMEAEDSRKVAPEEQQQKTDNQQPVQQQNKQKQVDERPQSTKQISANRLEQESVMSVQRTEQSTNAARSSLIQEKNEKSIQEKDDQLIQQSEKELDNKDADDMMFTWLAYEYLQDTYDRCVQEVI